MNDTTSIRRSDRDRETVWFAPGWPRPAAARPVDFGARVTFAPGWPEVALEPLAARDGLAAVRATGAGRR